MEGIIEDLNFFIFILKSISLLNKTHMKTSQIIYEDKQMNKINTLEFDYK